MPSKPMSLIPFEIWNSIVRNLDIPNLSNLCLVSHEWKDLALPHLYRIVYLADPLHLERFANRLGDNSTNSISEYFRGLVIDHGPAADTSRDSSILPYHMGFLMKILMAAPHLEHFAWELEFTPRDQPTLENLQIHCPKLLSFHFSTTETYKFAEPNPQLFHFKNLLHFSFVSDGLPDELDEYRGSSLAALLRGCPDIRTMRVSFKSRYMRRRRSRVSLFTELEDMRFGSLHTLHGIESTVESEFFHVFDSSHETPLRSFLLRHPNLRSLGFGWAERPEHYVPITSSAIEYLLPCLTFLKAPTFLCASILSSRLATQITSIAIIDKYNYTGLEAQFDAFVHSVQSMPNLRRLAINLHYGSQRSLNVVGRMLQNAPELEELGLGVSFDILDDVIDHLRLVPKAHKLSIRPSQFGIMHLKTGESGWGECLSVMAQICPSLQYVHELGPSFDDTSYWMIIRSEEGVEVVSADANKSELFRIGGLL